MKPIVYAAILAVSGALPGSGALAQEADDASAEGVIEEIVVRGSRLPTNLNAMPISTTIVGAEEIDRQLALTTDLGRMLGQLVPGLSTSSGSPENFHTSLRGRKPVFLIDGVPITATLNDVGRELRMIDPAVIQRVEVVRGSSALYGNSAGAGFINYITASGHGQRSRISSEVSSGISLTEPSDSLRYALRQTFAGQANELDYWLTGYYENTSSFFDADGDRIPPNPNGFHGLADSEIFNLFGKGGYEWSDQRVEASVNYHKQTQRTDYVLVPGNVLEGIKTTAVRGEPPEGEEPQFNESMVLNFVYSKASVLGSALRAQVYYEEAESLFDFVPNRFPLTSMPDGQSTFSSNKSGVRLDLTTTFGGRGIELLWGLDYLHDDTKTPLVDGRDFIPHQVLDSYAAFAQVQVPLFGDRLMLSSGVRHERAELELKDFVSLFTLANVEGGTLKYDTTPVNVGLVFRATEVLDVFAGYSQGFEISSIGTIFRSPPSDTSVTIVDPEANLIDSYEVGIRGDWGRYKASLAVFRTESTDGLSFVLDPNNPQNALPVRAPDKVEGFELTFDAEPTDSWRYGMSYSYAEGDTDTNGDGRLDSPLQNRRISPEKLTGYLEHDFSDRWMLRAQALYSGSRNKFPESVGLGRFWEGKIEDFLVVDLATSLQLGPGTLSIGINNLFNEDYFTVISQSANRDERLSKAEGATAYLKYAWRW